MDSVFIAGSITIKKLPYAFLEKIDSLLAANLAVIVGDADGVDLAVQRVLFDRGASTVTVYCSGETPRNNIGNWPIVRVPTSEAKGTRAFFGVKDVAMARAADVGLMLWDAKSTGTLSNVIELTKRGKKSVVFVNKVAGFFIVRDKDSLLQLVDRMSESARETAENKIGLTAKLRGFDVNQIGFQF